MNKAGLITDPGSPAMSVLCNLLDGGSAELDETGAWPEKQLQHCAQAGVYRWFLGAEQGGYGWDEPDLMRGYLKLSAVCMTTAFVLTQATGALRRIADSATNEVQGDLLDDLLAGNAFTTLGISHLTTSRRHLARPALRATQSTEGFLLNGFSPWVTGGPFADFVVIGAQLDDDRQLLAILPRELPGVSADQPSRLVALNGSQTGAVRLDQVALDRRWLLAGPELDVMQGATGAKTGGLQTSALAIGLADRAVEFLEQESRQRKELAGPAERLRAEQLLLQQDLLSLAAGGQPCSREQLRGSANSLALRSSQATLAAAKGTGYVQGHPAGRWCREAMFFLVWSCPQAVMEANLCELAGISD
ncbi:MAG: acyl-CoA/acyl-ACP dehydrogenase [Planctomycetales bacterium]